MWRDSKGAGCGGTQGGEGGEAAGAKAWNLREEAIREEASLTWLKDPNEKGRCRPRGGSSAASGRKAAVGCPCTGGRSRAWALGRISDLNTRSDGASVSGAGGSG